MRLKRMFVDVGGRRVHLRMMGSGPPVLLVHQSPRSSAEWLPLMARVADRFTLVAPDTPGFGESAPLPETAPEVADFARALLDLLDAMGIGQIAAYGLHSGAIILMAALKLAPGRFSALACGGYALWTEAERADFGARYTPAFHPSPYGEHLAWAWNRVLEQSWFFPWYRSEAGARLPGAHADVARVNAVVMEILSAGNSFSAGYAAVLRAPRDLPPPDAAMPPVLIAAHDGDPLRAHIDRLPALPRGWEVRTVASPAALEDMVLDWLQPHAGAAPLPACPEARDEGFVRVVAGGFEGLIHWRGAGGRLWLPAPGSAAAMAPPDVLAVDPPGHGLSDPWDRAPETLEGWAEVLAFAVRETGAGEGLEAVEGEGWSTLLAGRVARRLGVAHVETPLPRGELARWRTDGIPDIAPDRFGAHLHRAWGAVRAGTLFEPWFEPSAATARAFSPQELAPGRLAGRHLALLRATGGRALLNACLDAAAHGDKS